MTTTGQLDLGVAQVTRRGTGEEIGYVYTVEHGNGQLQRWLLLQDPQSSFDVRPAPATMKGMSLSDWQAEVAKYWKTGAVYVRAQADVYRYGEGTDGAWTEIPPADDLPLPTFPQMPGASFQLDYTRYSALNVIQGSSYGLAYSINGVSDNSNAEYWMLPAGFQPAGEGAVAAVVPGSVPASSLQQFVDEANKTFGPGCLFVITGCVNYKGATAPAVI
jgi:hypothetical protein